MLAIVPPWRIPRRFWNDSSRICQGIGCGAAEAEVETYGMLFLYIQLEVNDTGASSGHF